LALLLLRKFQDKLLSVGKLFEQLSAFIWSELFTTSTVGRNRCFSSKKEKTLGTSEKGFDITKKRGTKWLFLENPPFLPIIHMVYR